MLTFTDTTGCGNDITMPINKGTPIGVLPQYPTWENYELDGWYTLSTGGTKIDEHEVPVGDTTYYAQCSEARKIRWTANGGADGLARVLLKYTKFSGEEVVHDLVAPWTSQTLEDGVIITPSTTFNEVYVEIPQGYAKIGTTTRIQLWDGDGSTAVGNATFTPVPCGGCS